MARSTSHLTASSFPVPCIRAPTSTSCSSGVSRACSSCGTSGPRLSSIPSKVGGQRSSPWHSPRLWMWWELDWRMGAWLSIISSLTRPSCNSLRSGALWSPSASAQVQYTHCGREKVCFFRLTPRGSPHQPIRNHATSWLLLPTFFVLLLPWNQN